MQYYSRRNFVSKSIAGIGALACPIPRIWQQETEEVLPAALPQAKRIVLLFQSGGASQLDLFDYKPQLKKFHGKMHHLSSSSGNGIIRSKVVASPFKFLPNGVSALRISELLPHIGKKADQLCLYKSVFTDENCHHQAALSLLAIQDKFSTTSLGSYICSQMGRDTQNIHPFYVLTTHQKFGQPLSRDYWSSGSLPEEYAGVEIKVRGETGYQIPEKRSVGLPAQTLAINREPAHIRKLYGPDSAIPGSYAANCLLARKMLESGARCIFLFHRGWDHHGDLADSIKIQCRETDQPTAALIEDLGHRGLLAETLIIWASEFGRSCLVREKFSSGKFGRDHQNKSFTFFLAGAGIEGGTCIGGTDELGIHPISKPVHIGTFQQLILGYLGIDRPCLI